MLREMMLNRILDTSNIIQVNQSRCLRMRFNQNKCNRCVDYCITKAISIDERGLNIFRDACTECMLCVSECPSNTFETSRRNFYSIISRVNQIHSPVMGCNMKPDLNNHEKTHCLGFLSEEHLVILSIFMEKPLQINLTECSHCQNGFIVEILKKRLLNVESKISIKTSGRLKLVEEKSDLDYQDIPYNRRDLFKLIKNTTLKGSASFFDSADEDESKRGYTGKALPYKRLLLTKALSILSGKIKDKILQNYFYDLMININCDQCFACVGMCPTGSLKSVREEGKKNLSFNSFLCIGCGLCLSLCRKDAILIKQGISGQNPFEFNLCTS